MRSMTSAASSSGPGRLAALATAAAWLAAALCSVPPAALAAGSKDGTDPAALDRPVLGELMAETGFYQSMTLKSGEPLYSARSEYQKIEIVEAVHYGKVLVLDGVVQLTERDAASYNEMMAHVAMMAHPDPRRVLVIGGGDGYVLSEVSQVSAGATPIGAARLLGIGCTDQVPFRWSPICHMGRAAGMALPSRIDLDSPPIQPASHHPTPSPPHPHPTPIHTYAGPEAPLRRASRSR